MKHLRQYIRQVLLTEGMKTVDDLPDDVRIRIAGRSAGGLEVKYSNNMGGHHRRDSGKPVGSIRFDIASDFRPHLPCEGSFTIELSRAAKGWGPLLYDIAIEAATLLGNGLVPDRNIVSDEALKVWNFYLANRPDVVSHQLDSPENDLTYPDDDPLGRKPIDNDNCHQRSAERDAYRSKAVNSWEESALSKRYTKPPTTINALKRMGKLDLVRVKL